MVPSAILQEPVHFGMGIGSECIHGAGHALTCRPDVAAMEMRFEIDHSGKTFANLYRDHRATFEDGGYSVEPGLQMMLDRMTSGRWKVLLTCQA